MFGTYVHHIISKQANTFYYYTHYQMMIYRINSEYNMFLIMFDLSVMTKSFYSAELSASDLVFAPLDAIAMFPFIYILNVLQSFQYHYFSTIVMFKINH